MFADSCFRLVVRKLYKSKILYQIMDEYSFMNEGTLTRAIVNLFSPKEKGVTLIPLGIASALGIRKAKRRRRDFLAGITEFTLKDLGAAIELLSEGRNVLYRRIGPYASKAYAIKDEHLWRTETNEQYIRWLRTARIKR